ncbi:unnamed protein product [Schistosoma mattheei]|uniref:Uncharacterized protein n=1 Tax=Schistosoma mattheei TaxID=31246 RepID=A0A3P7YK02_9TREM|nr:unnamed protein product [Schistosoma mattheei]
MFFICHYSKLCWNHIVIMIINNINIRDISDVLILPKIIIYIIVVIK